MQNLYKIMLVWCLINLPFTFVFFYYNQNLLGSFIFLMGFLILNVIGLFKAHAIDKGRIR